LGLKLAHFTDSPAETVVIYSLLQSGGFHPYISNFNHGFVAIAYVNVLGGFRIMLPEHEIEMAKEFVAAAPPSITDFDPIKPQLIRDIIFGSILTVNPFFGLLLLPPYILAAFILLPIILFAFTEPSLIRPALMQSAVGIYVIAMLAHAKYIALPTIRKTKETS